MPAGPKRYIVAFDKRIEGDSTYGRSPGDWVEQFKTTARIRFLRGGEPIIGQRLMGVQPTVITTHGYSQTYEVTEAWRIRDVRNGDAFAIRSITSGERGGTDIDFFCTIGGPANADD